MFVQSRYQVAGEDWDVFIFTSEELELLQPAWQATHEDAVVERAHSR